jgi:hypothetical protein
MKGSTPTSRRSARIGLRLLVALVSVVCFVASLASSGQAAVPPPPGVYNGGASSITFSSAIVSGGVNAKGQATNYVFQYGTTSAYGAQTPLAPAGNGTITIKVSQAITGLQPATVYHFRVVAISPAGTTDGTDHTFTTKDIPLSLQIVGAPNPVVFGNPFFVEGTLSGTGAASHEIVLQAKPFPYLGGFKDVGNPEVTNSGSPSTCVAPAAVGSCACMARSLRRRSVRSSASSCCGRASRSTKVVRPSGPARRPSRVLAPSCVSVIAVCTARWSRSQTARTFRTTASRS